MKNSIVLIYRRVLQTNRTNCHYDPLHIYNHIEEREVSHIETKHPIAGKKPIGIFDNINFVSEHSEQKGNVEYNVGLD